MLLCSNASRPCGVVAKLADFGLSLQLDDQETHASSLYHGTPTHMAPEVIVKGSQSRVADV